MTEKQQQFALRLKEFQPTPWDQIPDLGLYMDQVITFVERQCKTLFMEDDRIFTPAMVNNYVKIGLIERPTAKKYGREQLAQLLMICVLKQSVSAENMKALVQPPEAISMQQHYEAFCQAELAVLSSLGDVLPMPIMDCALRGSAYLLLCNTLLRAPKAENDKAAHSHSKESQAKAEPAKGDKKK